MGAWKLCIVSCQGSRRKVMPPYLATTLHGYRPAIPNNCKGIHSAWQASFLFTLTYQNHKHRENSSSFFSCSLSSSLFDLKADLNQSVSSMMGPRRINTNSPGSNKTEVRQSIPWSCWRKLSNVEFIRMLVKAVKDREIFFHSYSLQEKICLCIWSMYAL